MQESWICKPWIRRHLQLLAVTLQSVIMNKIELGALTVHVVPSLPLEIDFILGLDVILQHGMSVGMKGGEVCLQFQPIAVMGQVGEKETLSDHVSSNDVQEIVVKDKDFEAHFKEGRWSVSWEWKKGNPPLNTRKPNYRVKESDPSYINVR